MFLRGSDWRSLEVAAEMFDVGVVAPFPLGLG